MPRPLYVEITMRVPMDTCWQVTQDPAEHQRWDARFTRITYLPSDGGPQRFRYATRVLPGLTIGGTGITAGQRVRPDGTRVSVLRFASPHPLSLIRTGAGYWRYVPVPGGLRFLTGYDYATGWGRLGPLADRAFRPLMGWATAWSFDRLRLWLERGISPRRALVNGLAEVALRLLAFVAAAALLSRGTAAGAWPQPGMPGLAAALPGGAVPAESLSALLSHATAVMPLLTRATEALPLLPHATAALVLLVVGVACLFVPPLPVTPAARRCLRRPPDRGAAAAPAALTTLEQP